MRIEQGYISPSLSHSKDEFLQCWNLREYDNPEEPAFFYGLYFDWDGDKKWTKESSIDIETYNNHKGFKVLMCGGAEYKGGQFNLIDTKNINFLSENRAEFESLKKLNIDYKYLPISLFDCDKYKPTPLGDNIYFHIPLRENSGDWGKHFERMFQYEKLMKLFGEDMFCFPEEWKMTHEMLPYFNQSFVNIKPHKFRGFVTSWKLGCMGRNTITTTIEDTPNFIHYSTDDELKRLVDEESKKIGTIQENKLWDHFHHSDDWLHEDYWK